MANILPPPSKTRYLTVPDTAAKKDSLKQFSVDEVKQVSFLSPQAMATLFGWSFPARHRSDFTRNLPDPRLSSCTGLSR